MGNNNKKPAVINPGQVVIQDNPIDPNFENFIKKAFTNGARDGKLYKDKFDDALAVLESFNIKRLRYTPLGERLFSSFDKQKTNYISEKDFLEGLNSLIQNKDTRIVYTFNAYDKDGDKKISRKEFLEFIMNSWKMAFVNLGDTVNKQQPSNPINIHKLNQWAQKHCEVLAQEVNQIFTSLDPQNKGYIDFTVFKKWIIEGNTHSIFASYENIVCEVPINLYQLEVQ